MPASSAPVAPAAAASATNAAATPAIRVTVARSTAHGPILADGRGRSLYLLEEDPAGGSGCTDMCAVVWPPYLAAGGTAPVADSGVRAALLGTVPRPGGGTQVSYGGHALYYYIGDAKPGDTRGQHVEDSWGEWYLVQPGGGEATAPGRERGGRRGRGGREDR